MGDKHGALFSGAPEYVKVSRVYKVSSVLFVKADTHTHKEKKPRVTSDCIWQRFEEHCREGKKVKLPLIYLSL